MFENRVLRRIFLPKRDEVTDEWRQLHNKELNDVYSPPKIIRMIKSRRQGWTVHVARIGKITGAYKLLVGKPKGENHLEEQGVDGRILLRWIFRKYNGGVDWIDMAQNMDRWQALVNAVMNFRVP